MGNTLSECKKKKKWMTYEFQRNKDIWNQFSVLQRDKIYKRCKTHILKMEAVMFV